MRTFKAPKLTSILVLGILLITFMASACHGHDYVTVIIRNGTQETIDVDYLLSYDGGSKRQRYEHLQIGDINDAPSCGQCPVRPQYRISITFVHTEQVRIMIAARVSSSKELLFLREYSYGELDIDNPYQATEPKNRIVTVTDQRAQAELK
jgi:hypothetical protein